MYRETDFPLQVALKEYLSPLQRTWHLMSLGLQAKFMSCL